MGKSGPRQPRLKGDNVLILIDLDGYKRNCLDHLACGRQPPEPPPVDVHGLGLVDLLQAEKNIRAAWQIYDEYLEAYDAAFRHRV